MLPVIRSTRDSWLPDIFNDFFDTSWMERPTYTAPAINVLETEKEYDVELAAPGLDKKDFKVHVDADNNLQSNDDGTYNTNFIIHNYHPGGWWDVVCWKPNSKEDPEFWPWWGNNSQLTTEGWQDWPNYQVVRSQGDKWCKVPVPTNKFGQYRLWFDAHLERAKLVPAK